MARSRSRSPEHRSSRHSHHRGDRDSGREKSRRDHDRLRDGEDYERKSKRRRYSDDEDYPDRDRDRSERHSGRDRRRDRERERDRSRSHSRERRHRHRDTDDRDTHGQRSRGPLPSQSDAFTHEVVHSGDGPPPAPKQQPNYAPSGLLSKEAATVAGTKIVLKYSEPPEARKPSPSADWRIYVFKDSDDPLDTLVLGDRSVWLFGREETVVDYILEHPSCSKQHAVVQFRYLETTDEYGEKKGKVRPFVYDLESANGTTLNGKTIKAKRYKELRDGDVLRFGESKREYVVVLPPK